MSEPRLDASTTDAPPLDRANYGDTFVSQLETAIGVVEQLRASADNWEMFGEDAARLVSLVQRADQSLQGAFGVAAVAAYRARREATRTP